MREARGMQGERKIRQEYPNKAQELVGQFHVGVVIVVCFVV